MLVGSLFVRHPAFLTFKDLREVKNCSTQNFVEIHLFTQFRTSVDLIFLIIWIWSSSYQTSYDYKLSPIHFHIEVLWHCVESEKKWLLWFSFLSQILCLHGGIPSPVVCPGGFVSLVNKINSPLADPENESSLAWEIMWNDPFSIDTNTVLPAQAIVINGFFNNTRRSTGKYFTNEALVNFLEKNDFTHVIRAHEVQQVGFKVSLTGNFYRRISRHFLF